MSHVDFLLAKYAGHEEDIIEVLTEKYGPEPELPNLSLERRVESLLSTAVPPHAANVAASRLANQFRDTEDVLMQDLVKRFGSEPRLRIDQQPSSSSSAPFDDPAHSFLHGKQRWGADANGGGRLAPSNDAEFEAALAARRQVFERDMRNVAEEKEKQQAIEAMQAVSEAKVAIQCQEVELQQLRLAWSALQMQATANEQALSESIQHVAQQLTQAKLRHLSLSSTLNPRVVSATDLQEVLSETANVERDMQRSVAYCQKLAAVAKRHLQLYPLTPMHGALRQADPALCARLDQS